MRALTPCCSVFLRSRQGQKGGKEQSRDRASTAEGAAEPAARRTGVLSASERLTRGAEIPAQIRGTKEACTASSPFLSAEREREENCRAKVYSNCLKRKGDYSLSVCLYEFQTTATVQHYSSMQHPLLWKAKSTHTSSKAGFAGQQS